MRSGVRFTPGSIAPIPKFRRDKSWIERGDDGTNGMHEGLSSLKCDPYLEKAFSMIF
jgi:hypothetical protein